MFRHLREGTWVLDKCILRTTKSSLALMFLRDHKIIKVGEDPLRSSSPTVYSGASCSKISCLMQILALKVVVKSEFPNGRVNVGFSNPTI